MMETVRASVGFFSSAGTRPDNQDFAGAVFGWELEPPRRDVVAVIADGIGGARGGRVAAETAVRGFLDGFCDLPESMPVQRAGALIAGSLNSWIYAQGHRDRQSHQHGRSFCTFTALVLRGRMVHILHAGDSRAYRISGDGLVSLTTDHVRKGGTVLTRALGVEPDVRLDYASQPVALHDRFLLCSDGVPWRSRQGKHGRGSFPAVRAGRHCPRARRRCAGSGQRRQLHRPGAGHCATACDHHRRHQCHNRAPARDHSDSRDPGRDVDGFGLEGAAIRMDAVVSACSAPPTRSGAKMWC